MTRVGMPSVWESTAWKTLLVRIVASQRAFLEMSGKKPDIADTV